MSHDQVSDHMVHNFKINVVLESNKQQAGRQADRQTDLSTPYVCSFDDLLLFLISCLNVM